MECNIFLLLEMAALTTITSKGQVVIPVAIRRRLGLKVGSHLVVEDYENLVVMKEARIPSPAAEIGASVARARRKADRTALPDIDHLRKSLVPSLRARGVTKAAIFGSFARREASQESDVDVLVELGADASLLDLVALKLELEDAVGRRIDLVEYASIKPLLRDRVLREGVRIL